jgi:hypothetical protein
MSVHPDRLHEQARQCGAGRLTDAALWELEALRSGDPLRWRELERRLRDSDDLWSTRPATQRLKEQAARLDSLGQRVAFWRYAMLPAWEETANATGCRSSAAHWWRFVQPARLWRGLRALLTNKR